MIKLNIKQDFREEEVLSKLNFAPDMESSGRIKYVTFTPPRLTLHGYLSKIMARSWQDLGTILAKIFPWYSFCHGKILSREPCSQEKFYCKNLIGKKKSGTKLTKINIYADLHC